MIESLNNWSYISAWVIPYEQYVEIYSYTMVFFKKLLPRYIYLYITRREKKFVRAFCGLIIWVWLFLLGEFCQMVDRDGRQVLMCTWGKKSMEDEMDFTMFGDFEHGDLIDINVGDLEIKSLYKYGLFSAWQVLLFFFFVLSKKSAVFSFFFQQKREEEDVDESPIIDYSKPVRAPLYTNEKKLEAPKVSSVCILKTVKEFKVFRLEYFCFMYFLCFSS